MDVRRKLVIGANWKMNFTNSEARNYILGLRKELGDLDSRILQVYILPPFTALETVVDSLQGLPIEIGAQNIHSADEGPYTGEISARQIKEIGCSIAMIGHSERRAYFAETDECVAAKIQAALVDGICPLVCIGEDLIQRAKGETEAVLARQLGISLENIRPELTSQLLILYEPRWAIGQSEPASMDYIESAHSQIRSIIERLFDLKTAQIIRILYGGSVNRTNIYSILCLKNVDGCGVGRASWDPLVFANMIQLASNAARHKFSSE